MTLGRTSSGAIKIKTDSAGGGLRAVECGCCECELNPLIFPFGSCYAEITAEQYAKLRSGGTLSLDTTWSTYDVIATNYLSCQPDYPPLCGCNSEYGEVTHTVSESIILPSGQCGIIATGVSSNSGYRVSAAVAWAINKNPAYGGEYRLLVYSGWSGKPFWDTTSGEEASCWGTFAQAAWGSVGGVGCYQAGAWVHSGTIVLDEENITSNGVFMDYENSMGGSVSISMSFKPAP